MAAAVLLPGWANEESGSWAVWGTRESKEMDGKEEKKCFISKQIRKWKATLHLVGACKSLEMRSQKRGHSHSQCSSRAVAVLLPGWEGEESGSWAVWGTRESQQEMDEKEENKFEQLIKKS
ncbi:hypothetical protein TYRP_002123 [Tyrophagus putrescentiae]|nr:hypothetical protein TYRP_002123 [Tyrophagus putrescentiae]